MEKPMNKGSKTGGKKKGMSIPPHIKDQVNRPGMQSPPGMLPPGLPPVPPRMPGFMPPPVGTRYPGAGRYQM